MTLGNGGLADGCPAAAVTEHCVMVEGKIGSSSLMNLNSFAWVCSAGSVAKT